MSRCGASRRTVKCSASTPRGCGIRVLLFRGCRRPLPPATNGFGLKLARSADDAGVPFVGFGGGGALVGGVDGGFLHGLAVADGFVGAGGGEAGHGDEDGEEREESADVHWSLPCLWGDLPGGIT